MRSPALFALATLLSVMPVSAQEPGSRQAEAASALGSVQLVLWNRAQQVIDVEVRLGDERVFAGQLRQGNVATSIEAGVVLQRVPGTYVLRVLDRTRNQEDSISVQIDSRGQNVGVHLTQAGLGFVLSRTDVTEFTPPPSIAASISPDVRGG
jgi:hypothetical protein